MNNIRKRVFALTLVLTFFVSAFNFSEIANADEEIRDPKFDINLEDFNGELIVKYKSNADIVSLAAEVKDEVKLEKAEVKETTQLESGEVSLLEVDENADVEEVIAELEKDRAVECVDINHPILLSADPDYDVQWGLKNTGQKMMGTPGTAGCDIGIEAVRGITQGDESILVAVIDTGIDINHPDLKDSIYVNPNETENGYDSDKNGYVDDISGWNFCNGTNQVYENYTDDAHGTHVAGIIAAGINGIGVEGIAPEVKLLPLKFLTNNVGDTYTAIEAIQYAEKMGASIVNCSWGSYYPNTVLKETIEESNMLFVCSAGNDYGAEAQYPAGFALNNVLSVAAMDHTGTLADFSNYGSSVDLAAPGSEIYSTVPNGQYSLFNGTSMAAPFVTGVAALVKSKEPALQADRIAERIKTKVTKSEKLRDKVASGGYLNAPAAVRGIEEEQALADIAAYGSSETVFGNHLYRLGGYGKLSDEEEGYWDTVSAYNITDNNWYAHSNLNVPRMNAAVFSTDRYSTSIWAIGGYNGEILDDVEALNGNTWNVQKPLPKPLCAPSAVYLNDMIYVFGGLSADGFSDRFYTYNFWSKEWVYAGQMPYKAAYSTVQVIDDTIYLMGGVNDDGALNTVYAYHTNAATPSESWEIMPPMNYAKQNAQSIVLNGKLYVFGGITDGQIDFEQNLFIKNSEIMMAPFLNTVEQFDFTTGAWTDCIPMKTPRMGFSAGALFDRVLLTGGWNGKYLAEDEIYLGAQIPNNVRGKTSGDQITFQWDPVNGADGYELELDGTPIAITAGAETVYTITEPTETVHRFRVRAKFGDAYGGWSDLICTYRNSTRADALELSVSEDAWTEAEAQLIAPDKQDKWYKVSVDILGELDIELLGQSGTTACLLEVYDSAGNLLAEGLDNNGIKRIDALPVAMYNYYIRIFDQAAASENVRLRVKLTKTVDIADIPSRVLAHSVENAEVTDEPTVDSAGNAVQSLKLNPQSIEVTAASPEIEDESPKQAAVLPAAESIHSSAQVLYRKESGQINDIDEENFYRVTLNKGQRLVVKLTPPKGSREYGVYIYEKSERIPTYTWRDPYENPDYATVSEVVAKTGGEYVIMVQPRSISTLGKPYNLEYWILNEGDYDGAEPNFTPLFIENEGYFQIGGRYKKAPVMQNLNLDYEIDKDYYKISNVQTGDKITMMLETTGGYTTNLDKFNFDVLWETSHITEADGWIAVTYKSCQYDNAYFAGYEGKTNAKVVSFIAQNSGDYYVAVRAKGGYHSRAAGDKYALTCTKVSGSEFDDKYEKKNANDFSNDFIMINKKRNPSLTRLGSESVTGAIDNELDIDWYAVETGAGQTLQAVLDGSDFARNNCKLYLCEQRGGDNQNPRLIKGGAQALTIDQAGTYFVGVYADNWLPNGNTGYTISLNSVPLPSAPITFNQNPDGGNHQYIFVDQPEHIRNTDIINPANDSDRTMLMHIDRLTPGTYTVLSYHHKAIKNSAQARLGYYANEEAFTPDDALYFDGIFYNTGTDSGNVKITKLGLQHKGYDNTAAFEQFLASENQNAAVQNVRANTSSWQWVSDYVNDTDIKKMLISDNNQIGSVYLMMEFEVTGGTVNFSTMAYLGDSSAADPTRAFKNMFLRDQQLVNVKSKFEDLPYQVLKGVGNFGQTIESNVLKYTIDDSTMSGSPLRFKIPTEWGGEKISDELVTCASNLYYDTVDNMPSTAALRLTYDGENPTNQELIFDSAHYPYTSTTDPKTGNLRVIPDELRIGTYSNRQSFQPNETYDATWLREMVKPENRNRLMAMGGIQNDATMQGYGVTYRYIFEINNKSFSDRYFTYHINPQLPFAYYSWYTNHGESGNEKIKDFDVFMAKLPGRTTTRITLDVTQLPGSNSTIKQQFFIN